MNWDDLRIVGAAASARTLTSAAKSLRVSVATVSRRIDAFEAQIGLRLFDRTASGIKLTPHGQALLSRSEAARQSIESLDRFVAQLREGVWPDAVRVSATEPVIADILAPALPRLIERTPRIRVDLSVSSDIVSLAAREAEVAIRFARPVGNSLVARRLPPLAMGLYAAPALLGSMSPAMTALQSLPVLSYDDSYGDIAEIVWLRAQGLSQNVVARLSSTRGLLRAAEAGAGIAILPRRLARHSPSLLCLPSPPIPSREVWMVTHRDLAKIEPLRIVRQWIVTAFGEELSPA